MEDKWKKPIQKPIGVYVWVVLIIIKFGILNFVTYFIGFRNADGEIALPIVLITFLLCLFTVGAAIWALTGDNAGRIALMILVPLNILWIVLFDVSALLDNFKENDEIAVFSIIQQVMISLFVIGFEWYFISENVVEYYKQND